jgi:hypothetical protein
MLLASKRIPTGCHFGFLDDCPFYAELEHGLSESWRESEALKFCNAIVNGGYSPVALKVAAYGVRTGPWMVVYGMRSGYMVPADLETANLRRKSTQIISASPISLDCAEQSPVLGGTGRGHCSMDHVGGFARRWTVFVLLREVIGTAAVI